MQEKEFKTTENNNFTEYRPWGYYTILEEYNNYKVKKLVIKPNSRLSLQYHKHREEVWVVVQGRPTLLCNNKAKEYNIGELLKIQKGEVHRIQNNNNEDAIIIEVQNGSYLGEDDIIRIEDDYLRN